MKMKLKKIAVWSALLVLLAIPAAATDLTIDQLTAVGSVAGGDELPLWHSGATYKATVNQLGTQICGGTCVGSVTAGDASIIVGGTGAAPTVQVTQGPRFATIGQTGESEASGWLQFGAPGSASANVVRMGNSAVASTSYTILDANADSCGTVLGVVLEVRATAAKVVCVDANGNMQLNGSGALLYATGANLSGLTASTCVASDGSMNLVSASNCIKSLAVSGPGLSNSGSTVAPIVTMTASPTFGQITDSGLTSGNCMQASTAGLITTTGAACSSGGVTSVSAGSNIVVTGTTTVTVAATAAPVFSGSVTASAFSAGTSAIATGALYAGVRGTAYGDFLAWANGQSSGMTKQGTTTATLNGIPGEVWGLTLVTGISNVLAVMDHSGNFSVAGELYGTGANLSTLTASSCVGSDGSKNLVSASSCVVSVGVAGPGLTAGGTASAPVITATNAPTFTGTVVGGNLTDSALTSGRCVQAGTAGLLGNAAASCRQFPITGFTTFINTALTASTATNVGSAIAPALGVSTGANGNWLVTIELDFNPSVATGGWCAITSTSAGTVQFTTYSAAAGTHTSNISNNLSDNSWLGTVTGAAAISLVAKYVATYANSTTPSFQGQCYTTGTSKVASGSMSVVAEPN